MDQVEALEAEHLKAPAGEVEERGTPHPAEAKHNRIVHVGSSPRSRPASPLSAGDNRERAKQGPLMGVPGFRQNYRAPWAPARSVAKG